MNLSRRMAYSNLVGPTHIVVGDPHCSPEHGNRRFDWLGQLIMDERPDVVVIIGDMASMDSLRSFDKGTKGRMTDNYQADIDSVRDALDRMLKPLREYNEKCKQTKRKRYKPRLVFIMGNHEYRINRLLETEWALEGKVSLSDLGYEEAGFEVYPFLESATIDGVCYQHYFASGVMDRPIGGEHPGAALLNKQYASCTAGHLHCADWAIRRDATGKHIMGAMTGCFFEHREEYASKSVNAMWWRGILIKRNVVNGVYDPQFLSLNTMRKIYGGEE